MNKQTSLNVNIKNNRIWLPKEIQEHIGNEFIEVEVGDMRFITKLTKDGRFFIPKTSIQRQLNGSFEIKFRAIKNLARPTNQIGGNLIDVLAFIPKRTLSGYDILALEESEKLRLWYSTKGRPNELVVNRFVPLDFLVLLGYYQAEGGKTKLHKRRGREMSFTNADAALVEDFLHYLRQLINVDMCKATVRYNDKINYEVVNEVKNKLISLGLKETNIKVKPAGRIRKYTVKIWASNSILGELVNNMMTKLRENLAERKTNETELVYFLQGAIAGDGNFSSLRDKNGSLHSYLRLYESKEKVAEDYLAMFKKLGISAKIRKVENYYWCHFFVNWQLLMRLMKLQLLNKSPDNYPRLIRAVKEHRNYKFGWLRDEELIRKVKSAAYFRS